MSYFYYFLVFVFGLMVGSFLNAWIWRTRENLSIVSGRSMCPRCRKQILWYDNIPLISCFLLKRKCRHCQEKISWQYPAVELAMGILFLLVAYLRKGENTFVTLEMLRDLGIVFFLVFIFIYDLKYKEILDMAVLPLTIIVYLASVAENWQTWQSMIIGAAIGAGFFFVQFFISNGKWIGGGDIRLGLLMGVILSWPNIIVGLILAYVLGAVISLTQVVLKKKNLESETPFGTYLTVATFIVMFWGDQIVGWYLGLLN